MRRQVAVAMSLVMLSVWGQKTAEANTAAASGDAAWSMPPEAINVVESGENKGTKEDLKAQWEQLKRDVERTKRDAAAKQGGAAPQGKVGEEVVAGASMSESAAWEEEYEEEGEPESAIAKRWQAMDKPLELRHIDKKAMEIAKAFEQAKNAPLPVAGTAGRIRFTYGTVAPRIVCRPMRVTDLQMEPGEKVLSTPCVGDSVRWSISPSMSMEEGQPTVHVMIQPSMPDIGTNLTIHTDRRTYLVELTADKENYMPFVSFFYPENTLGEWQSFVEKTREDVRKRQNETEIPVLDPSTLDFQYTIKGSHVPWKPLSVFNDHNKTYIQMNSKMKRFEAPALVLLEGRTRKIVNYRVKNDLYVVDRLFKKGMLIIGKDKVTLTYTGEF